MFVLRRERRRGIGRLLMEALEPLARERGRSLSSNGLKTPCL
jgi:GNAT superfamily N-acetyltransferase